MKYFERDGEIGITDVSDFDLERIFECGQCFRWNSDETGAYTGVARGVAARIRKEGDTVFITGSGDDFERVWCDYFDLDRDYAAIRKSLCIDDYMTAASNFGAGIRILRQDKWEALCSFIISQCNNIPRIKKNIETFCGCFGEPVELLGDTYYTFPTAEKTSELTVEDLAPMRCGYRAPYIIEAAKAVTAGDIDLEQLAYGEYEAALMKLKSMNGIGDKVANCVILFGLQKLNAFPIDVWMKKAIAGHYGNGFDPSVFGEYAGLAQQYMFYYTRSGEDNVQKTK